MPALRSSSFSARPSPYAFAKASSASRGHAGSTSPSSYTEMPSVTHRGTRWFDSWSVNTWASSCHMVACQLNSPGFRDRGESWVTTDPKLAPSAPSSPGMPAVRTAKSSCLGKIRIRDGAARVDAVAASHLRERPRDQRPGVEPEHRRFVGVHPDGRHAALLRLEPVERVEDPQQVQRHQVGPIAAERRVEHAARLGLGAKPQQVHAEVGVGRHVRRLERHGSAPERHGLVEAVLAGRVGGDGAVGVAACRVDGERPGDLGFVLRRPPGNPGDGCQQRVRLRASRVDGENAVDGRLRLGRLVRRRARFRRRTGGHRRARDRSRGRGRRQRQRQPGRRPPERARGRPAPAPSCRRPGLRGGTTSPPRPAGASRRRTCPTRCSPPRRSSARQRRRGRASWRSASGRARGRRARRAAVHRRSHRRGSR